MDGSKKEVEKVKKDLENIFAAAKKSIFTKEKIIPFSDDFRILHIDDQAKDGWSDIIQYIFYGSNNSSNYQTVHFENSINIDTNLEEKIGLLFNQIKDANSQFQADVILLDGI